MSNITGLIGHTGFVGSNLLRQEAFTHCYNSTNSAKMRGQHFDHLICSGMPAVKWKANKDPSSDREAFNVLWSNLKRTYPKKLVLISTVDVFHDPNGVNEESLPDASHAYGINRYELEQRCFEQFDDVQVFRLPALFGPGLKKNVLFDLLTNNNLDRIHPDATFQWYDVTNLRRDIAYGGIYSQPIVHLAPEPIKTSEIIDKYFPDARVAEPDDWSITPMHYSVTTKYHGATEGGYCPPKSVVMSQIGRFIERWRSEEKLLHP